MPVTTEEFMETAQKFRDMVLAENDPARLAFLDGALGSLVSVVKSKLEPTESDD